MAIPGTPRVYARNIAEGFAPFSRANCRLLTPAELKSVYRGLELVVREFRSLAPPLEETRAVQYRNQVLQRASAALMLIRNHARRNRIVL